MLMICCIASSWPTMRFRKSASSFSASNPVCAGLSCLFKRPIGTSPFTIRDEARRMPDSVVARKIRQGEQAWCATSLAGLGRTHVHTADHGAGRHFQDESDGFCHILGCNFPLRILIVGFPRNSGKLRIDATGKDGADPHIVVSVVQH